MAETGKYSANIAEELGQVRANAMMGKTDEEDVEKIEKTDKKETSGKEGKGAKDAMDVDEEFVCYFFVVFYSLHSLFYYFIIAFFQ